MDRAESVLEAVDRSIDAGIAAGTIDAGKQAGLIAVTRKIARNMDEPGWPIVLVGDSEKMDNINGPLLIKYLEVLGLTVEPPKKKTRRNSLDEVRGKFTEATVKR